MKSAAKKLAGIRRYQAQRPVQTQVKLLEALKRMETDQTIVVGSGFSWSKTTLAREASVNINTVVKKVPGGKWAFPEINQSFERLARKHLKAKAGGPEDKTKASGLLEELKELRRQNRLLALEVNRLGLLLLAERDRAERMIVYEKQNISLREEISRNHRREVLTEAPIKRK
jgi:hypothetical protein